MAHVILYEHLEWICNVGDVFRSLLQVLILHYLVHWHANAEKGALIDTSRLDTDGASTLLHYLLDYGQAKADTITIEARSAAKLSELSKKFWHVLAYDTDTRVFNMQD